MRRFGLIALVAASMIACTSDSTGPGDDLSLELAGFGTALTTAGGYEADLYAVRLRNGLPDSLRLTDAQRDGIKALVDAFEAATKADREAIGAILRRAREAAQSGKTRDEVRAILREGAPIRDRLAAAHSKLKADIDAILTAEQRAWIADHSPRRCDPRNFPPLTDAQKAQIRALEQAFATANAADLATMKGIVEEARAAAASGASREEIAAIFKKAEATLKRLASARQTLREAIAAVLTPAQKASGCLPLG
jgi:Spy/CpxP family protein refolding chaperone